MNDAILAHLSAIDVAQQAAYRYFLLHITGDMSERERQRKAKEMLTFATKHRDDIESGRIELWPEPEPAS